MQLVTPEAPSRQPVRGARRLDARRQDARRQDARRQDARPHDARVHTALLVTIVAVGAGFRLWQLGANRLGYDEAFTAMAGRMPLGSMFSYLRANDSHPPLDYLFHLPLARLGVSAFSYRLPSALCSIGALALFASWMRSRGRAGVIATAVMAVSAFQLVHGRNARMYAELELLGVAVAVLAEAWLRRPRKWHAPALAGLVLVGLLTHVSLFLLGAGLLVLAGLRRDREAWRWRAAVVAGGLGWAVLWGSSFLVQTGGGHSDWIPRTTVGGIFDTVSSLTTNGAELGVVVFAAVVAGGLLLWRRDVVLGRVWVSCFTVTVTLAALAGLVAPVLLDRTLTVVSWGPLLAIGVLVDAALTRSRVLGAVAVVVLAGLTVPAAVGVVTDHSGPTTALRRLEVVARPGDVIAVRSAGKLPEIAWSLGVRGSQPWRQVAVAGLPRTGAIELGTGAASGRVWVLDWGSRLRNAAGLERCAPDWKFGVSRILCLQRGTGSGVHESLYAAAHERLSLLGRVTATR